MSNAGAIAAQTALFRQSFAIETLKIANEQTQALVSMVSQASQNVPVSQSSGVNLDISV